jgi:PAS domain S-box-containing protein
MENQNSISELVRAGILLANEHRQSYQIRSLVDQVYDITRSNLTCLYQYEERRGGMVLVRAASRGGDEVPDRLAVEDELIEFMEDCGEPLVLGARNPLFFETAFLAEGMKSAMVLPLFTATAKLGYIVVNSKEEDFYQGEKYRFLESFARLAGGMLYSTGLYRELQRQFQQVEELERYQENIFSSMTNLLITTDERGNIHYFNRVAAERLGLDESLLGKPLEGHFRNRMGKRVLGAVKKTYEDAQERLGLQGILRQTGDGADMDFSLNVSPLLGRRGRKEGLTLLFTDQTRERELQAKMETVVEDRRLIKDMFARYLSNDIVQTLMDKPELVKPGGDKKTATIFFADIRGYTSFSETKEPEYIIEVLNEYFSQAVEVIIRHRGYIDKFIGDAIMAAWGVPMYSEQEDAVEAVGCAVELQELVKSKDRSFFTGDASHLKVGIGMHTGPLIAGNLGSSRRMDYSVIGDTVNVAARLEGVAGPSEVIITQVTRDLIGDRFKLKELEPVKVKGKTKPIHIFSVLKQVG